MQQLDIFIDSRDRVLINRLADALSAGAGAGAGASAGAGAGASANANANADASASASASAGSSADDVAAARGAAQALQAEFPAHRLLPAAALLTATLEDEAQAAATPWPADAGASALAARQHLAGHIAPAAQDLLGSADAARWLAARWRALARRAAAVPYAKAHADAHAAALWLQAAAWAEAARAAEAIESWRRRPLPLAWAAQARWHLQGTDAAWPLLAELAWLAPARVAPLVALLPDAGMRKLARRFEADAAAELCTELSADTSADHSTGSPSANFSPDVCFDVSCDVPSDVFSNGSANRSAVWAWWPAWLLIEQPLLAEPLSTAQPQRDSAAERAFGLLRTLLHLERQGRHADRVAHRRQLADLSPTLFRCYMATR